ncbi:hypothetical protein B5M44_04430 [Shinella sumterensis]|uniref:hypothetical protein n=1 Tax=Shinella sumterensis TaxID=1967501 RepID=UPI00106E273C|nr:hypothetical protein [Shinella sumterensis]MCD1264010.1 hypothetical protein [Shinella sumterensis]TFE99450.1 hypothetical protein B5M44_04430 [Shinella sumterensis]
MKDLKPFLDDMLSMSTGTDGRTLEIHFSRPVTKEDRQAFADAHNAIVRGQLDADRLTGWESEEKLTIEEAWTILCETPDITSPEEYPDHALITMEQLGSFMARAAPVESGTSPILQRGESE